MFRGDNATWTAKLSASDMAREFERVRTTYYTVHVAECVKKKRVNFLKVFGLSPQNGTNFFVNSAMSSYSDDVQ